MAKRFTDTEKWKDEWYGSLSNDYRIVWQYLLDNCSIAGVFKKDYRLLNFQCNTNLTEQQLFEIFDGRIIDCGKFIFIPKFLKFQYPKGLKSNKPAIVGVRLEIEKYNLNEAIKKSLPNDYLIIKDKDKDKDKEKDENKDEEKVNPEFILNQMLAIHLEINPDAIQSREDDLPAVRKIAEFISKGKGVEHVKPDEITDVWRIVCQGIKQTSFWNGKSLKSIAGNFQSVITEIKKLNGNGNNKNGKYSTDEALEILRQQFTS